MVFLWQVKMDQQSAWREYVMLLRNVFVFYFYFCLKAERNPFRVDTVQISRRIERFELLTRSFVHIQGLNGLNLPITGRNASI